MSIDDPSEVISSESGAESCKSGTDYEPSDHCVVLCERSFYNHTAGTFRSKEIWEVAELTSSPPVEYTVFCTLSNVSEQGLLKVCWVAK